MILGKILINFNRLKQSSILKTRINKFSNFVYFNTRKIQLGKTGETIPLIEI